MSKNSIEAFFLAQDENTEEVTLHGTLDFEPQIGRRLTLKQLEKLDIAQNRRLIVRHVFSPELTRKIGALDALYLWEDLRKLIRAVDLIHRGLNPS